MPEALRSRAYVRVCGAEPWRFADRCVRQGILLRDVRREDEFTLRAVIALRRLETARTAAARCGCTLEVVRLGTATRVRAAFRRRRALTAGFALLLSALLASSLFVWDIQVVGNDSALSDAAILRVLGSQGVGVGSFWPAFRAERIRTRALRKLPALRFLTVNVRGSRAFVTVRAAEEAPEIFDARQPTNVEAARPGVVASIVVLSGEGQVTRGAAVTRGQTLISGTPAVPRARGVVRAYTYRSMTAAAPLRTNEKRPSGRVRRRFALILGRKRINFTRNSGILPAGCDRITQKWDLAAKGLFTLPVSWVCETVRPGELTTREIPPETAVGALRSMLSERLRGELGAEGEVLSEHWSMSSDGRRVLVTLNAQCVERIDVERPAQQ